MIISVNVRKTEVVIEQKEDLFFKPGNRGVFFVWSAAEASELYLKYSKMGYKCGFYASQNSLEQITREVTENLSNSTETTLACAAKVNITEIIAAIEQDRQNKNLPSIDESLKNGLIPDDLDFLFVTSILQEGFSLSHNNNLSFFFIEDCYPASIDRKISCYHGNLPLVYLSIPRRRLEKLFKKTIDRIDNMEDWSQERRRGYYEKTLESHNTYHNMIWINRKGKYKLTENLITYITLVRKKLDYIESITTDQEKMINLFGTLSKKILVENITYEFRKHNNIVAMQKIIDRWDGRTLYGEVLEEFVNLFKNANIVDLNGRKQYTFQYIRKFCIENNICSFSTKRATKRDVSKIPYLERNKIFYTLIKMND